jgi:hypothetical protein
MSANCVHDLYAIYKPHHCKLARLVRLFYDRDHNTKRQEAEGKRQEEQPKTGALFICT